MNRRKWLSAVALLCVGCGGGSPVATPVTAAAGPITQNFDYTLTLTPTAWSISGPEFTSRSGPIDVVARIDSPVPLTYQIDLLYTGGEAPHNEGSGGVLAQGPGPFLSARWEVGSSGSYRARIYPLNQPPLRVPPAGINVPVAFTITHP